MRNTAVNEFRSAGLTRPVHVTARGVTLIEVLVAVLVISIGLLGLAALQAAALQANETSYQRSQATNLAYDVIDRMRANRTDALVGNGVKYNTDFTTAPVCAIPNPGSDLAETDLNEWRMALACGLPNGEGFIDVDTSPAGAGDNLVTVTIRWADRDAENAGDWESFTTRTEL